MLFLIISNLLKSRSTILRGILQSGKFVRYVAEIPCDIIQTLEDDASEAENFVKQIEQHKVPSIIKNLPQEIVDSFTDIVNITLALPSEVEEAAEAAVTGAVKLFNDIESGAIVSDIKNIEGVVVSDVTAGWGDFTAGVLCFFGNCATATPSATGACMPASTFTTKTATGSLARILTTPTQHLITSVTPRAGPAPGTSQSFSNVTSFSTGVPSAIPGMSTASSSFESNEIKLCAIAFLAVAGVAILL